jgi:membrane protein DedA with SNARE-associated domain
LIGKLGYLGIALLLILGGLGLPVPEEVPIILAAVLSKNDRMWWPLAFGACFVGVLAGDFLVYFLGYFYGEKVMSLPLTRRFLTRAREAQIKGYFHRHGFKILILGRFAVGFRTAAYLTAGILQLPVLKLFLTDLLAAALSTVLMFGLGYYFAHQIEASFDQVKHWLTAIVGLTLAIWIFYRYYKERQRAGQPVGPPVLVTDDVPLPLDDLHAHHPAPSAPAATTIPARPELPPVPLPPEPAPVVLAPAEPPLDSAPHDEAVVIPVEPPVLTPSNPAPAKPLAP